MKDGAERFAVSLTQAIRASKEAIMAIAQTKKCQGPGCGQIGKRRKITDKLKGRKLEFSLCDTCWSRLKAGDRSLLFWSRDFADR